jgi:hypothetical protein
MSLKRTKLELSAIPNSKMDDPESLAKQAIYNS